jgi:hypothetical protein
MQNLTTLSKSIETDKSCLTTVHNEYARDWHYWKKIPTPDRCLRGSMPETDYPDYKTYLRPLWEIQIQIIEWDNNGSLYTSTPTQEGNTTIQPDVHRTNPLMPISWTNIAFIGLTIPFVCGHHCISYLIRRCAGQSMTDVTSLLENPVEATTIVQNVVLLLDKHVLWKKRYQK